MRPSAGHGWTRREGIDLIVNDAGEWIPSGQARGWKRCVRCRKPCESLNAKSHCEACVNKLRQNTGKPGV